MSPQRPRRRLALQNDFEVTALQSTVSYDATTTPQERRFESCAPQCRPGAPLCPARNAHTAKPSLREQPASVARIKLETDSTSPTNISSNVSNFATRLRGTRLILPRVASHRTRYVVTADVASAFECRAFRFDRAPHSGGECWASAGRREFTQATPQEAS